MMRKGMVAGALLVPAVAALVMGVLALQGPRRRHVYFREAETFVTGSGSFSNFGPAIAAGDVTGDGLPDVVFGAKSTRKTGFPGGGGVVFVSPGPFEGRTLTIPAPNGVVRWGAHVAVGELDGKPPLDVVGSTDEHSPGNRNYLVVVFGPVMHGGMAKWQLPGAQHLVQDMCIADVTGDGQDDLITVDRGPDWVHLYAGPILPGHPPSGPTLTAGNLLFPFEVESRDLDGDAFSDVVVGLGGATVSGLPSAGEVQIFYGPDLSRNVVLTEPQVELGAGFGADVSIGDFDADGIWDLAASAPLADFPGFPPNQDIGEVFFLYGPDYQNVQGFMSANPQPKILWGDTITAMDVDGDGLDDLAMGAPYGPNTGSKPFGQVEVYRMPSFQPVVTLTATFPPEFPPGTRQFWYGTEVISEDLDRDGREDLIVGADNATVLPDGKIVAAIAHGYLSGGTPVVATLVQERAGGTGVDGAEDAKR